MNLSLQTTISHMNRRSSSCIATKNSISFSKRLIDVPKHLEFEKKNPTEYELSILVLYCHQKIIWIVPTVEYGSWLLRVDPYFESSKPWQFTVSVVLKNKKRVCTLIIDATWNNANEHSHSSVPLVIVTKSNMYIIYTTLMLPVYMVLWSTRWLITILFQLLTRRLFMIQPIHYWPLPIIGLIWFMFQLFIVPLILGNNAWHRRS